MSEHRPDFLTRCLVTGIIASAILIGVAPLIRPAAVPAPMQPLARAVRTIPGAARTADWLATTLLWVRQSPTNSVEKTASVAPPATPGSGVTNRIATDVRPPPRPVVKRPPPPPPPPCPWAVICAHDAAAYRDNGKLFARLPAGAVVAVLDTRQSSAGDVVRCRQIADSSGPTFFVKRTDLTPAPTDYARATKEEIELRRELARLNADTRRPRATAEIRANNPHAEAYERTRTAYKAYWDNVNALKARWETAEGDARMRYGDELRVLKGKDIVLGRAYEKAREQYNAWNAQHPEGGTQDRGAIHDRIADLEHRLRSLQATP
jgi:hypothetical protein